MGNKKIELSVAERDLLHSALLSYRDSLTLLTKLPDDKDRKDFFKAKIERVVELGLKIN